MIPILLAFAGLALTASPPAQAAERTGAAVPEASAPKKSKPTIKTAKPKPAPSKASKRKASKPAPAPVEVEDAPVPSAATTQVADWVAASTDNASLPYAIIDKNAASLVLFDGQGKLLGQVPVLIGVAPGDDATPGIGSKNLAEIGPAEKTTPAGRFLAKFGLAAGRQRVLWVDYATSVALHPIPPGASKKERRRERILSPTPDDNRITFGCINVPQAFYTKTIAPMFRKKGGYVYILPDSKPMEIVFPRLRVEALVSGSAL